MEYKNLPDLSGLAALRAIVELGGVNEAAASLHVGQPAITKRLRALENCYGEALMERKGRRLRLTLAGEKVYAYARLALDHHHSLQDDLDALQAGRSTLRLEVTSAIGEHLLPDLLVRFAAAHPEYRIESRMNYSRWIQTRLATGLADLALIEMAPEHPDILVQKWLEDELLLVCGPNHPLWKTAMLPLEQLHSLKYVLRESQASTRLAMEQALGAIGIHHIPVAMEVGSTDTIVEMLQRGPYVSFLPRFAVAEALQSAQLFHIRVQGLRIIRTLWAARTRATLNNPVANAFIALLHGVAAA